MAPEKTFEEHVISTWKASPKVQEEFHDDFTTYVAYREAKRSGNVRIIGNHKEDN